MTAKEHIKQLCLLGVEKRAVQLDLLPAPVQEILGKVALADESEKALVALSCMQYYEQSGSGFPVLAELPATEPIVESQDYIVPALQSSLAAICKMDRHLTKNLLLQKWIEKTLVNKEIVTAELCVPYINLLCQATKKVKRTAMPTLGKRALWLIGQDDRFEQLRDIESKIENDVWNFGTKDSRAEYITALLTENPIEALGKIEAAWPQETIRDKRWILECIKSNIDPSFQTFLESLYQNEFAYKEKELKTSRACRNLVAGCLLLLADTDLQKNTITALLRYNTGLAIGRKKKMNLKMPTVADAFFNAEYMMIHYGIDLTNTEAAHFKSNAIYAFSILSAHIPFDAWAQSVRATHKQLATFFLKNDQFESLHPKDKNSCLLPSMITLASCSKSDELTEAILPFVESRFHIEALIANLSARAWERAVLTQAEGVYTGILKTARHQSAAWSSDFSASLLKKMHSEIAYVDHQFEGNVIIPCLRFLPLDAIHILEKLDQKINQSESQYLGWKKHVCEPILNGLKIRKLIEQS